MFLNFFLFQYSFDLDTSKFERIDSKYPNISEIYYTFYLQRCHFKDLKSGNRYRHLWRAFVAALLVTEERTQFHLERLLLPIPKL